MKLTPVLAESDETHIKVHRQWRYLYRAVDRSLALVDVMFSEHRDMAAAKAFLIDLVPLVGTSADRTPVMPSDLHRRAKTAWHPRIIGDALPSVPSNPRLSVSQGFEAKDCLAGTIIANDRHMKSPFRFRYNSILRHVE
jgi:hypothetical protein